MENTFKRVVADLKSRDFRSALQKIKELSKHWTAGHGFKFLRTVAILVKDLGEAGDEALGEVVCISSNIVIKDETLTETNDITQGLIATYHLALYFLGRAEYTTADRLATCNLTYVILTAREKSKEVQTVAVNLSHQLCKATVNNKIPASNSVSLRKIGLKLLLYGGPSRWLALVEQVNMLVNMEANSDPYISLFEELLASMDQLRLLWDQESDPCLNCSRLQLWALLKQTTFMKTGEQTACLPAQGLDFSQDFIDTILGLCGTESHFKIDLVKDLWKVIIAKGPHKDIACLLYLRIGAVAISIADKIIVNALNKNAPISASTWKHYEFVADVLIEFYSKVAAFKDLVQKYLGMGQEKAEITCLTRATSIFVQLNLKDPSKETNIKTRQVFQCVDKVLQKNRSNDDYVKWILTSVDPSSYNAGVALYRQNRFEEAGHFFRKSVNYLLGFPDFRPLEEKAFQKASARLDVLYDCRKATSAWTEFALDVKHFLLHALWQIANESLDPAKEPWLQKLLQIWATLKRDLHLQENVPSGLVKRTVLDLLSDVDYSAHYPSQRELLLSELRAYDTRKGSFPRSALASVALQILPFAGCPGEKLRAQTFALADDSQPELLEKEAKAVVSSLTAALFKADDKDRLELKSYLAVAYFRLHVASEAILKEKIKEETERMGPLLSSSSSANIPKGEDGSNNLNSGTDVSTLHCALKYSDKSSDSIIRCLEEWEDLLESGWGFETFSNYTYGCVMSLAAYFALQGNNYFRSRALYLQLRMARDLQLDDVCLTTAAEMLKLGVPLSEEDRLKCEEISSQYDQHPLEGLHYRIGKCYALYYSGDCTSSKEQLGKILKSATFEEQNRTKSVVLVKSQACLLDSQLLLVPFALKWKPALHEGPLESALLAFQDAYACYKSHEKYAAQYGWDYPGVEWQVLDVYLKCAFHLASLYSYAGCARENRHYLKEALVAAQKHAVALRAAEAMLRLSHLDIVLNNEANCQAKLACCYNFLVSSPVIAEPTAAPNTALQTPVAAKPPPKSRGKKLKDIPVNLSADPTHRSLQMMGELPGASPSMRTRDVTEVSLTDFLISHANNCSCYRCSQELLYSLQCLICLVQARMYSMQGTTAEASTEFQDRYQQLVPVLAKLTEESKAKTARSFFSSSTGSIPKDHVLSIRRLWLQPVIRQLLDFRLHFAYHLAANDDSLGARQVLEQLIADTQQHVKGVIDHHLFKLMEKMSLLNIGLGRMEEKVESTTCFDALARESNIPVPPTPASKPRRLDQPPKLAKRNNVKKEVGQLFDDWEENTDDPKFDEQDYMFSKKFKGKPAALVIESSDDEEPPVETTPTKKTTRGSKTQLAKPNKDEDALCSQMGAVAITAKTPAPKTVRKKLPVKPIQDDEDPPPLPKGASAAFAFQTPAPATGKKTRKPKAANVEEEDLAAAVQALTFQTPAPSRSRKPKAVAQDKEDQHPAESINFRTPTPASTRKPRPPKLFDDEDDDNDAPVFQAPLPTPAPKSRRVKIAPVDDDQAPGGSVAFQTPAPVARRARAVKPANIVHDDDMDDFQVPVRTPATKSRKEVLKPTASESRRKGPPAAPLESEDVDEADVHVAVCRTPAPRSRRTKPGHVEEESVPDLPCSDLALSVTKKSTRRAKAATEEDAVEAGDVLLSSASSSVRKTRKAPSQNMDSTSSTATSKRASRPQRSAAKEK